MSEFYRDRTEGALARRQDLLRKRRDELVLMPHAVRRVVVARAARAAGSAAAIACGVFMIAFALSPTFAAGVAHYLPGINPAVISTAVAAAWVIAVVAYSVSRGRSEHRFAVAMSTYVLPGDDLDEDIERLSHERPDKVAREMAHRLEIASAALPVAAAAIIVPATLVYLAGMVSTRGWPSTAMYESELVWSSHQLLYVAIAGVFAAVAMTQRALRRPRVTRIAGIVTLVALGLAVRAFFAFEVTTLWVFTAIATIGGAIAIINARLARERVAIEALDPAAGAELFTIAGALRSLRASLARMHITPRMTGGAAAFGVLVLAGGASVLPKTTPVAGAAQAATVVAVPRGPVGIDTPTENGISTYGTDVDRVGRIVVTATFSDGKPLHLRQGLLGLRAIPAGWRARIAFVADDTLANSLSITPVAGDPRVVSRVINANTSAATFDLEACDGEDRPLDILLTPADGTSATVKLLIDPSLSIAHCDAQ